MRTIADIESFLEAHADLHALLVHVGSLDLPDGWIGAGFIRNAVWDRLHGRTVEASRLNDIDVIFFDPLDIGEEYEIDVERRLGSLAPQVPWSVKNQARMHARNGDAPYRDTRDAISHWPETATAIAARSTRGRVEVIAPYGIDDLLNLIVRPTPAFAHKMDIYHARLSGKNWPALWPKVRCLTGPAL